MVSRTRTTMHSPKDCRRVLTKVDAPCGKLPNFLTESDPGCVKTQTGPKTGSHSAHENSVGHDFCLANASNRTVAGRSNEGEGVFTQPGPEAAVVGAPRPKNLYLGGAGERSGAPKLLPHHYQVTSRHHPLFSRARGTGPLPPQVVASAP